MTPEEVSPELMAAAMEAVYEQLKAERESSAYLWVETARHAVAAVLPLHEQQVREQIAGSLWGLPIVQHLGIYGSQPVSQHAANTAEAALQYVLTLVLHPDQIPERQPR